MLPKFSVKKPYTIFVSVIIIIVLGFISFTNLTTDLLPKMDLPYAIVVTTYPGASPEKIETTVTKIIEETAATVTNVKNVRSISSENSSMIIIEFVEDTNMDSAMIELNNQLDLVKGYFDEGVGSPIIMKINPDMLPVMISAISIDNSSISEISTVVNEEIIPKLKKTNGVATVNASGIVEEDIRITLNQNKIDNINDMVLSNIDEKLSNTEKELNEAQSKLNDARTVLDNQSKEQSEKIVSGLSAINQGKKQIEDAQEDLNSKKKQLTIAYDLLTEISKKLSEQLFNIQSKIDSIKSSNNDLTYEDVESINRLTDVKNTVIEGINQNNNKITEIETGINQIEYGKSQLDIQLDSIYEQEKALEIAKITLPTEISKAYSSLNISQAELDKGRKEFETAREEAYKNANIKDIITQSMIANILKAENFSMPAGTITSDNNKLSVKIGEKFSSIDEIKNLTIFSFDIAGLENVTLEQLADISFGTNSDELYTKINDNDSVIISFQKQSISSTTTVSNDIKKAIDEIEKENPNIHFTTLMDQGMYINIVTNSVLQNLFYGGSLAILILLLFLRDIKPTLIISLSIPISLTFAIALMFFTGVTINIISLSGLALGVGMLVDNSIVVIENIYRLRNNGLSTKKAAIEGASTVAGAILASTLTTVCVFLPIVFTKGISRQLFTDMGLTIAYSLLASLIIALTLVPAMASSMFKKSKKIKHRFFDFIINIYEKLLKLSLRLKPIVIILSISLLIFSGYLATRIGTNFIPEAESTQMSLSVKMPKESNFEDLKNTSNIIIDRLLTIDDIQTIGAIQNGSSASLMTGGNSKTVNMYAILNENKTLKNVEIKNNIINLTKDLNCEIEVSTSNMDLSALSGSGLEIVIKGNDIPTLENIAKDISNMLSETEGISKVDNGISDLDKELKIVVDKNKAMKYGITVATVFQSVSEAILVEKSSTTLSMGNKDYPIVVVQSSQNIITEENLKDIELDGKDNQKSIKVKLSDISTINQSSTLSAISHNNNQRYITVSGTVDSNHNIGLISREFEEKLNNYSLPQGYTAQIQGESENINNTLSDLLKMIAVAILFIYLIMVAQFQSLLAPFIIMFTIPLAFTGGLFALAITGTEISVIAMLGFLVLSGIVVNNGIVLIDYINQLIQKGLSKKEAIIKAGSARLRPILMTALTTILGLLTLAFGVGSGAEILQPLGIVTIGGLVYSTLLTLIVVPCIYDLLIRKKG